MQFSSEELGKFASWEPVVPGYDRNVAYKDDVAIQTHILPLIKELTASGKLEAAIMHDGGLSNYFAFFVHETADRARIRGLTDYTTAPVPGVTVYLSLLAPVGVFGRQTAHIGPRVFGQPTLGPDDVCDPDNATGSTETAVLAAVSRTPYRILTRNDVNQPLPENVTPFEYCLCSEPWDRVFHVLFSNTD